MPLKPKKRIPKKSPQKISEIIKEMAKQRQVPKGWTEGGWEQFQKILKKSTERKSKKNN